MDEGTRHYLFWLWQYEARNDSLTISEKVFKDNNYHIIVPMKGILDNVIAGKFSPWPPPISGLNRYQSSVTTIPNDKVLPMWSTWNKAKLYVSVNVDEDIDRLTHDFRCLVARYKANALHRLKSCCPTIEGIDKPIRKAEEYWQETTQELDAYLFNDHPSIRLEGAKRATGLWMWDRVQELGEKRGMKAQAIRDFLGAGFDLIKLGLENKVDSDYHFYRRRTSACIESGKVLPFT